MDPKEKKVQKGAADRVEKQATTMEAWTRRVERTWIVVLIAANAVMLLVLLLGVTSLNVTFVIFLVVVKFIAGLGTIIGIISFLIFVLKKFADKFSGDGGKKKLNGLLAFAVILIIGLLAYQGPVKLVQSALNPGNVDSIFDQLLFVYGIVSLLATMYIKPLWKDELLALTTVTTKDMVKHEWDRVKNVTRAWVYGRKKEHGKAELVVELSLKQEMQLLRQRMALVFMLPLGIGTVVFTPVAAVMILAWLRTFVYTERPLFRFERGLALGACVAITGVASIIPFTFELTPLYAAIQSGYIALYIAQFTGMLIAAILYLTKLLRPILRRRAAAKLKAVSKEREALAKERDQLAKERKQLLKEVERSKKENAKPAPAPGSKKQATTPPPSDPAPGKRPGRGKNTAPAPQDPAPARKR